MIKTVSIILFSHFICYNCQINVQTPATLVSTSFGYVRGTSKQMDGKPQRFIVSFRGVPFAEPPIKGYRFRALLLSARNCPNLNHSNDRKLTQSIAELQIQQSLNNVYLAKDPQPLLPWKEEKLANKKVLCPQINPRFKFYSNIQQSEDCLYLNIFYPFENSEPSNLPVLVYFHGGEFNFGGKDYYGPEVLLRDKNMVLVTVNYRLGVFGFLSTNDENIPGNFGIKDQIAALNFVSNEIDKFRGDKSRITIFGHDAGAISVDIHRMLPERMAGKFSASISSGGTLFTPWALQHEPYENALWFAGNISCSTRIDKLLYCLQQKTKEELISVQVKHKLKFRPVVDRHSYDSVLKDDPLKLYQSVDFRKQRNLFGLTSKEGALDFYSRYSEYGHLSDNKEKIKLLLEPYFKPYANKEVIATLVHYKYFDEKSTTQTQSTQETDKTLVNLLGSYLYESPTDKSIKMIANRGISASQASLYVFEFKGQKSFGTMLEPRSQVSRDAFDVTHSDDVFSIFKIDDDQILPNPSLTTGIINCLFSFMTASVDGVCQRPYFNGEGSDTLYFAIDAASNLVTRTNFRSNEETKFWNELVFNIERLTSTRMPYFDYGGYSSYRTATWSLFALIIVTILFGICVIAFIIYKKKKDKTSLQFLKKRDKELEERYNFL